MLLLPERVAWLLMNSIYGDIAQLVEHMTENHGVGGSIPPVATI